MAATPAQLALAVPAWDNPPRGRPAQRHHAASQGR
jgi:hypothetical protein